MITKEAALAFRAINGVACIYKPAGISIQYVKNTILSNICSDLNSMEVRPPEQIVKIIGPTNQQMKVRVETSYADSIQVVGPRYQMKDIKCNHATDLQRHTSGVLLLGFNKGTYFTYKLNIAKLTRCFKVHGELGKATDTYFTNGKVVEKATYHHINRSKIDNVVSHMQAMHQRKMYEIAGVDINSEAGYELATMGPIRPAQNVIPILYGIKCVHFESPNFIIEVQCVNEYEKYLHTLVHDIGIQLKSVAHATKVQCIRHGKFTVDDALLRKHWTLQNIVDSISNSKKILNDNPELLHPKSAKLQ